MKVKTGYERFLDYLRVIPAHDRQRWIVGHIGNLHDEIDKLKADLANLKRRATRIEKKP